MIDYISIASSGIPLIVFLFYYKKMAYADKILFAYVCLVILTNISLRVYTYFDKYTVNVIHIYLFFEIFLFTYLIKVLVQLKWLDKIFWIGFSAYMVFAIVNTIYWEPFNTFNSNLRSIENLIIILFCLLFYYNLFQKTLVTNLSRYPYFYGVSGMLIYFSGTFFIYMFAKYMNKNIADMLWLVHAILNILLNTSIAITLWLSGTRKSKSLY